MISFLNDMRVSMGNSLSTLHDPQAPQPSLESNNTNQVHTNPNNIKYKIQ